MIGGGSQCHHQSLLNSLPWKEGSIVVIRHLEIVLPLWLCGMEGPQQFALLEQIVRPALIREKKFVSNTTDRKYFAIDIKSDEVHCKLRNYIYLLTCTHCGSQYVGKSITPLNLRKKIHKGEKIRM